jgi:hypothetical protein
MKLCKASGIKENTSWWASDNYNRRLSHEGRREKKLLKEIVKGELRSMVKELLEEVALVEREAFCESEEEAKNGFYPRDIEGFLGAVKDIKIP